MVFKKNPNNFRRLIYSKGLLFFLVFVLAGTIFVFSKAAQRKRQVEKEIDALKQEIEKLSGRNGDIASLLENFGDKDYLEQEARLRLNLKKKGEEVAIVLPQKGAGKSESENVAPDSAVASREEAKQSGYSDYAAKTGSPKMNNLKKWLAYFFE